MKPQIKKPGDPRGKYPDPDIGWLIELCDGGGATGRKPKGGGKDPHPGRLPGGTR
jgi:hypothetical protein